MFDNLQVGDQLTRVIAGILEMPVRVQEIHDDKILCAGLPFDRKTGKELNIISWRGGHYVWSYLKEG